MKSTHPAYNHLRDLCEDLAADHKVGENLRHQLGRIHTAMDSYQAPFHKRDVDPVLQALHALGEVRGKPSLNNLSHLS